MNKKLLYSLPDAWEVPHLQAGTHLRKKNEKKYPKHDSTYDNNNKMTFVVIYISHLTKKKNQK